MVSMHLLHPKKKRKFRERRWIPFERQSLLAILAAGFPAALLAMLLVWTHSYSRLHQCEATGFVLLFWVGLSFSARNRIVNSIRVLSNVISSVREEDFSFRAARQGPGDALGELALEINELARSIESERMGAMEAERLLRKVMSQVEDVILAFSPGGRLKMFNPAASGFFDRQPQELANRTAQELGVADLLEGDSSGIISRTKAGIEQRWIVRRAHFRQNGIPHVLLLLSEASHALRAEERKAWQRLFRVLSHEINNSLAPIKSISRTLAKLCSSPNLPQQLRSDLSMGLDVISTRSEALNHFLQAYARIAKLPAPARRNVSLPALMQRVIALESRLHIRIENGPDLMVQIDPDQLEQALINLTRNAVDAVCLNTEIVPDSESVSVSWYSEKCDLRMVIRDRGPGIYDTANLFVPFYTTKSDGSGIGLVLSRQIIEGHGGSLRIHNRQDVCGAEVEIRIPSCITLDASRPPLI
jgi:two-component system nitrogen regulation sensor histidine kinase NtrY